ncbi:MAG: DNA translocase FtsK 4TM domain-containing protein [Crocinitomicaceae bacterium]
MEDNEFIPKRESNTDNPSNSTRKRKVEKPEPSRQENTPARWKFLSNFDSKRFKVILGSTMTLVSLYLFLACVSYMFTWTEDQDRILHRSFFEYIFDTTEAPVQNWLGKFGAWSSHLMIYRLFGVTSFGICFLLFISGIRILFDYAVVPIGRAYTITIAFMLWGSLFLGFFSDKLNYLGGTFGFYINEWLMLTLGSFGAFALSLVLLYILITLIFNPNYTKWLDFIFSRDKNNSDREEEFFEGNDVRQSYEDIFVVNTIKDEEIQSDIISETVDFSTPEEEPEEDEDVFYHESELFVSSNLEKETEDETDEFEIEMASEPEPTIIPPVTPTPAMGANATQKSDDDDLAKRLVSEYGEYDPTKDLEGYVLPPLDLMTDYGSNGISVSKEELETNKDKIVKTLQDYKIEIAKIKATVGPTVTLYEIVPAPGVRISKIKNLEDDIALSLSALGIRIIAPIPGKGTIGIEVPNSNPEMVSMRSLIASDKFQHFDGELPIVMGKTITNETYVFDLTKMPHLLVAGATGQGKSVGLNAILISILYKKHPAQVKFVLVDPKKVELTLYNKIERHFLAKLPGEEDAIITDTSKVVNTLNSLCIEMDDRYELLKDAGVRTIKEYNAKFIARRLNPEKGHRYLPYIVVLIDEFADLIMTAGKEVEHPIARIAQLARAIGIHLIVATQRPSVNVITGMIKANFPARIAFRVLSKIDSRTILDASGADQLIGRGDMLISTGSDIKRLQCGFVDTPEVEEICSFIGDQRAYPEALILPEYTPEGSELGGDIDMNEIDPMFVDSARIVVINQQGSASLLQRKLKLGYNRAGRIVDQLEGMGIIGSFQGSKAREVLFGDIESLDEFLRTKGLI